MDELDFLLLVIASASRWLKPAALQKSMFVIERECRLSLHQFTHGDFGPVSVQVWRNADALARTQLVTIRLDPYYRFRCYRATPAGISRAAELRALLPESFVGYVCSVVSWAETRSFSEIVTAVKRHYH